MIKTVKDLKDYLSMLPDDALVYEQITTRGKHLEAVNPRAKLEQWGEPDEDITPMYSVIHYYEFPDFVQVPLNTKSALDYLKRYYENKEK